MEILTEFEVAQNGARGALINKTSNFEFNYIIS